ncbi:transmembrane anchor protein [Hydrogenophaga sp. PAMC20947]|uniref:transmembrane anchor protein n=1 Tax=Hydrogenophaga sp. PAMC20947 TaxID=2565558 RepID=UPI00109DD7D1|nr:transmembrane anchor protein [Hydrogenophaga sp. PAMC20947]QCB44659.1 transmembrane anchor protein [Hydrogenophaga sp. PAMC20947]
MYNSDTPARVELPSSKQLLRSTILAAISALVLLVAVVLPAEYGIDPTGVGRALRLTGMGEVKQQLAAEAAADAAGVPAAASTEAEASVLPNANAAQTATKPVPENSASSPVPLTVPKVAWRDEIPFTLTPGEGTEIKLKMVAGAKAPYAWVVKGGAVNFDTHGDAPGKSISYEKGRGVASDEGVLEAAFTGNHGWYWRNRGQSDVQLVLRTRGDYSEIKQ